MNTFFDKKKPFNPNIKKIYPIIKAPIVNEDIDKISKLFILVEQGNIAEVKKFILTTRVKLNAKYNDETILHKVLMIDNMKMSESKKLDFIDYLVSNGALINSYNKFSITPLHLAVLNKYRTIVKYFIDKNVNIDAVTNENLTPLHYATLINIDSCPEDNMPQNLIPNPESKNINYNEISKRLIKAFKDNDGILATPVTGVDKVAVGNNDIDRYNDAGPGGVGGQPLDDQGVAVVIGVTEPLLNILNDDNISVLNNLIKYKSTISDQLSLNIKKKIEDKQTNITNLKQEDIIEPIFKSEIDNLKKNFSIKDNFIEQDIDSIIEEYSDDSEINYYNKYKVEQANIINKVTREITDEIKKILVDIIDLRLQDNNNNNIAIFNIAGSEAQITKKNFYHQVILNQAQFDQIIQDTGLENDDVYIDHIKYYFTIYSTVNLGLQLVDIKAAAHREPADKDDAYILNINYQVAGRNQTQAAPPNPAYNAYNPPAGQQQQPFSLILDKTYKKKDLYDHYNWPLGGGNHILPAIPITLPGYNIFLFYFSFLIIFNDRIVQPGNKSPLVLHNILNLLLVINKCIYKFNKFNNIDQQIKSINKIDSLVVDLIENHKKTIQDITKIKFFRQIYNTINPPIYPFPLNFDFSTIILGNAGRVPDQNFFNFDINKMDQLIKQNCVYDEIIPFSGAPLAVPDPNGKKKYLIKFIDKDCIQYGIALLFQSIKKKYIFYNKQYYIDSFNLLGNLQIPNEMKHKIIRECIYKIYNRIITDYVNNLINVSIREIITLAFQQILNVNNIEGLNIRPLITQFLDIYLPEEDFSFNSILYTNEIIKTINDATTRDAAKLKLNNRVLNIKLIEDEDYDIYNDENFKSDIITIQKLNKYYPIFYSYNYEGREINKECIIIDYGLIEDLLKAGSNINIKDQTGKTVIDYIIEAKMHYILNETIKKKLITKNLQYVLEKTIKNEKEHNNLFGYNISEIKFLKNYEKELLDKLKNIEEIRKNIPINIKNIFKIYLLLQNIYWYRMLNKEFFRDNEYLNLFNIEYDNTLFNFIPGITGEKKLKGINDWKNIISDIEINIEQNSNKSITNKESNLSKNTTLIEKTREQAPIVNIDRRLYIENKNKIKLLKKLKKDLLKESNIYILTKPNLNINPLDYFGSENITIDKSILYFRTVFKNIVDDNINNPPIIYTYIWEMIRKFNKPYFIHLKICNIYNEILEIPIINKLKQQSYSAISLIKPQNNINVLDQEKLSELNKKISLLNKYMEPISKFIDGRMYNPILSSNPLLLFQIRTIVHILSTFLGSNLIMFIERLLYKEFEIRYPDTTPNNPNSKHLLIIQNIQNIVADLKQYVTSDLLVDGYLSYDFVKLIIPFKITDNELPREINMDDIFENILIKLKTKSPLLDETEENKFIINNIRTKVIPYYQSLYKEVTIQLLNFSDSYYRFIKNQYAGIIMLNKSI